MEPRKEVALFIDFENIRYGTLNAYGVEPRASLLIETARKYGLVNIARAYADFEDFPSDVLRDLQVSGITAVNVPAHQVGDRKKSGADMDMLTDIVETMLDRAAIPTILLMTGDRDFLRVVTMARNRFGKDVVISGVPGTVSYDLISASGGNFDPLEIPGVERIDGGHGVDARGGPASRIERIERAERRESQDGDRGWPRSEGALPRSSRGGGGGGFASRRSSDDDRQPTSPVGGPEAPWARGKLAQRAAALEKALAERGDQPGWSGRRWEQGEVVEGTVKSITEFGAFLDLGGVDALLHVSQMAWQHVRHPSQVVTMNQRLRVQVLEIDESTGRVSVGLKQLTDDPWLHAAQRYEVGAPVHGRVSGVKEYGVFVELEPGIFGLLHISNIFPTPWGHHPSERYRLDQEIDVLVSKVDLESRRLAFTLPGGEPQAEAVAQISEEDEDAAEAATRWREGDDDEER
ncbi:MAG: S1 RNA-binding domain-containing protein [Candidatus Eisenbacteria bacterium]